MPLKSEQFRFLKAGNVLQAQLSDHEPVLLDTQWGTMCYFNIMCRGNTTEKSTNNYFKLTESIDDYTLRLKKIALVMKQLQKKYGVVGFMLQEAPNPKNEAEKAAATIFYEALKKMLKDFDVDPEKFTTKTQGTRSVLFSTFNKTIFSGATLKKEYESDGRHQEIELKDKEEKKVTVINLHGDVNKQSVTANLIVEAIYKGAMVGGDTNIRFDSEDHNHIKFALKTAGISENSISAEKTSVFQTFDAAILPNNSLLLSQEKYKMASPPKNPQQLHTYNEHQKQLDEQKLQQEGIASIKDALKELYGTNFKVEIPSLTPTQLNDNKSYFVCYGLNNNIMHDDYSSHIVRTGKPDENFEGYEKFYVEVEFIEKIIDIQMSIDKINYELNELEYELDELELGLNSNNSKDTITDFINTYKDALEIEKNKLDNYKSEMKKPGETQKSSLSSAPKKATENDLSKDDHSKNSAATAAETDYKSKIQGPDKTQTVASASVITSSLSSVKPPKPTDLPPTPEPPSASFTASKPSDLPPPPSFLGSNMTEPLRSFDQQTKPAHEIVDDKEIESIKYIFRILLGITNIKESSIEKVKKQDGDYYEVEASNKSIEKGEKNTKQAFQYKKHLIQKNFMDDFIETKNTIELCKNFLEANKKSVSVEMIASYEKMLENAQKDLEELVNQAKVTLIDPDNQARDLKSQQARDLKSQTENTTTTTANRNPKPVKGDEKSNQANNEDIARMPAEKQKKPKTQARKVDSVENQSRLSNVTNSDHIKPQKSQTATRTEQNPAEIKSSQIINQSLEKNELDVKEIESIMNFFKEISPNIKINEASIKKVKKQGEDYYEIEASNESIEKGNKNIQYQKIPLNKKKIDGYILTINTLESWKNHLERNKKNLTVNEIARSEQSIANLEEAFEKALKETVEEISKCFLDTGNSNDKTDLNSQKENATKKTTKLDTLAAPAAKSAKPAAENITNDANAATTTSATPPTPPTTNTINKPAANTTENRTSVRDAKPRESSMQTLPSRTNNSKRQNLRSYLDNRSKSAEEERANRAKANLNAVMQRDIEWQARRSEEEKERIAKRIAIITAEKENETKVSQDRKGEPGASKSIFTKVKDKLDSIRQPNKSQTPAEKKSSQTDNSTSLKSGSTDISTLPPAPEKLTDEDLHKAMSATLPPPPSFVAKPPVPSRVGRPNLSTTSYDSEIINSLKEIINNEYYDNYWKTKGRPTLDEEKNEIRHRPKGISKISKELNTNNTDSEKLENIKKIISDIFAKDLALKKENKTSKEPRRHFITRQLYSAILKSHESPIEPTIDMIKNHVNNYNKMYEQVMNDSKSTRKIFTHVHIENLKLLQELTAAEAFWRDKGPVNNQDNNHRHRPKGIVDLNYVLKDFPGDMTSVDQLVESWLEVKKIVKDTVNKPKDQVNKDDKNSKNKFEKTAKHTIARIARTVGIFSPKQNTPNESTTQKFYAAINNLESGLLIEDKTIKALVTEIEKFNKNATRRPGK